MPVKQPFSHCMDLTNWKRTKLSSHKQHQKSLESQGAAPSNTEFAPFCPLILVVGVVGAIDVVSVICAILVVCLSCLVNVVCLICLVLCDPVRSRVVDVPAFVCAPTLV